MKFDFRVGIALAALAVSASCSQTPQAPTTPSATAGSASAATGVGGSTLKVSPPALVSPVEGERVNDRRPTLVWANAIRTYGAVGVAYDIEVHSPTALIYPMTVGETPDFGQHLIPFDLEYDTTYSWRVRAREGNEFGPWSSLAEFKSPLRAVPTIPSGPSGPGGTACTAPISPLGSGETRKPRPNDSGIVRQVVQQNPGVLARSCQEQGGTWEFMDRSVDALRAKDGRYGYNAKRGNMNDPSMDVISYYWGGGNDIQGSTQVYIFDLVGGHCGPNPTLIWGDVTDITFSSGTVGRTMYPRPGRRVTVTPCQ